MTQQKDQLTSNSCSCSRNHKYHRQVVADEPFRKRSLFDPHNKMADHAASMHHPQSDNLGKLANLHKCKSPSSPCDNTPISPWGISLHPASHHRKLLDTVTNSYKPCLTASNVKGLLKTSVALVSNKAVGGFWGITESSFKSLRLEVRTAKMQSLSLQRTRDCRLP